MTISTSGSVALILILISSVLLIYISRRIREQPAVGRRRVSGFEVLRRLTSWAVESGQVLHYSPGRGNLGGEANPASLAALTSLKYIAREACANDVAPIVTVGDGTLLISGQDTIHEAYAYAGRPDDYNPLTTQFIASNTSPMSYGAGVSDIINRGTLTSNAVLGRVGSELVLMTEAGSRQGTDLIVGTDNLSGLAVAVPATEHLIIGEELFAASAYLNGEPADMANLQLQDILRIVVALSILVSAIINIIVG